MRSPRCRSTSSHPPRSRWRPRASSSSRARRPRSKARCYRKGTFNEPVTVKLTGLPAGLNAQAVTVAAGASDFAVKIVADAKAAASTADVAPHFGLPGEQERLSHHAIAAFRESLAGQVNTDVIIIQFQDQMYEFLVLDRPNNRPGPGFDRDVPGFPPPATIRKTPRRRPQPSRRASCETWRQSWCGTASPVITPRNQRANM